MYDLKIKVGNFRQFGVELNNDEATFTYEVATEETSAVLLYDKKTKALIKRVEVGEAFVLGRVCSISISGPKWDNVVYLLEQDGVIEIDPYAPVVVGRELWNDLSRENDSYRVYGGVVSNDFAWEDASFTKVRENELSVYKLHMRGFTMQQSVGKNAKGNVDGFLKKLDDIKDMGFSAVMFMPLYDFEEVGFVEKKNWEKDGTVSTQVINTDKVNYWGYGKASYLAPKASYFGNDPVNACKKMINELHKRNMECFMEIDCSSEISEDYLLDILLGWVRNYHIDGFRLIGVDLPIERIANNPFLGKTRIFHQEYPYHLLEQQKIKHLYIDDEAFLYNLRRVQNHKDGNLAELANQFRRQDKKFGFINYSANTSGFTLMDSFSYSEKHNEANGENNSDGNNYNCSDNYGIEGKTNSKAIQSIRVSQAKMALCAVILSQSVPMVLAGDELLNSQDGNNNAYCQDNAIGWVTYSKSKDAKNTRDFVADLLAFRKAHPIVAMEEPMHMNDYHHRGMPDLSYHGSEPWMMWIGPEKRALGILYAGEYEPYGTHEDVMICYNFHIENTQFALPRLLGNKKWFYAGDNISGSVLLHGEDEPLTEQQIITVAGGSVAILVGKECDDVTDKEVESHE